MYMQMASTMAGLPKFASLAPEYAKLADEGLPPSTIVGLDGQILDPITGRPITEGVGALQARRAGQIAAAQDAQHVRGQEAIARQQAGLDRETNWQKYAAENQFKGPQLLRAPDGSVVGVTPTQIAANATNGALRGYRPLTDEDEKALGALGAQYAKDQASLPDVRQTQTTLANMLDQAKSFQPGTFGDIRHAAGRLLTGLGVDPDAVSKVVGNPAGADVITKETLALAMRRLKQNFGASREAGFIVQKTMEANPNIATQPEAYSLMLNSMNQEAQRQADYIVAEHAYRQQHGTIDGFAEQFDRTHPVNHYFDKAMADAYNVPAGSRYLGRNKGRPVFAAPNGKKFMVVQ
jgi:hypothetical protein